MQHKIKKSENCIRVGMLALMLTFSKILAVLPPGITIKPFGTPSTIDFVAPISFLEIPGKPGTFVIIEKAGRILYYEPNTGKASVWLQIPVNSKTEEGLYTIAFHPDFKNNGRYFAFFSPDSNKNAPPTNYGHPGEYVETLAEYVANADHNKDSGKPPKIIRDFCCKEGPGHNGMYLVFGKDGLLYLTIGDGNSNGRETQTRQTLLGTILRIDVDNPDPGKKYGIPKSNPFYDDPNPKVIKEIWAYGFRNSFKLSIDPYTGDLWVGNVGGWMEDHVSLVKKADNFGWPITEGTYCFDEAKYNLYLPPLPNCDRKGITPPTIPVTHRMPFTNKNSNCVIGPVIYRANPKSAFYGAAIYADYTASQLWAAEKTTSESWSTPKEYSKPVSSIIHLLEATNGRVLAMGYGGKQLYYLDHPDLLLEPTKVKPFEKTRPLVQIQGEAFYNASGKRLIKMPFYNNSKVFSP